MTMAATALPPLDAGDRLGRLRDALPDSDCDALLVTNLVNIRWLTGFTGSRALLAVDSESATLITDARYDEQAGHEIEQAKVRAAVTITRDDAAAVRDALGSTARVGLEADSVTWGEQRRIGDEWLTDSELVPTAGIVAGLRRCKDPGEVARIAAAAAIADEAVAAVVPMLARGCQEREVALELDATLRRLGASGPAFETIVASGPNASRPHGRPSSRGIQPGDLVIIDVGAVIDGYHSDMTRTVAAGMPDPEFEAIWRTVVEAQAAGVAAAGPGVRANVVDAACRTVIGEAGWGEHFIHGTGHGVGLQIHEEPWLGATTDGPLLAGDVITVEPGIYVPGRVGVRIEDTVVVTEDGCATLTATPKRMHLSEP